MTYDEALAYVASLAPRGWRLGLDRMRALVDRAGLVDTVGGKGPRYIHIAGTNGKGSVTAFVQSMLVELGVSTGAFYSPYVVDPRERIQLGRELISREEFATVVAWLRPIAESFTEADFDGISEFEFKTAVGFETWRRHACEWVALEVGLGGRLDATNVVAPVSTAIVSIGHDHLSILGDTLGQIATEKAGIAKPGVPLVVGQVPDEVRPVIAHLAAEAESPVWWVGREIQFVRQGSEVEVRTPAGSVRVVPALVGPIQDHNVAVAVGAVHAAMPQADPAAISRGAQSASLPGRFQTIRSGGTRFILDGAHNPEAAMALLGILRQEAPGRHVAVIGMVAGHDPESFFQALGPAIAKVVAAPIDFHRAQPPAAVADAAAAAGLHADAAPTLEQALETASAAAGREGTVLVTGSFYLVGETVRLFADRS